MRELDELIHAEQPAWPVLQELFAGSAAPLRVLPVDSGEARRTLLQMQVTARSALGSMALNCGGLVVDDGWVRVFGGGSSPDDGAMPSLAQVNAFPTAFDPAWHPASGLIVGHDILGGVFALNGLDPAAVGRPGVPGQMTYFAPDTRTSPRPLGLPCRWIRSSGWPVSSRGRWAWLIRVFSARCRRASQPLTSPVWT